MVCLFCKLCRSFYSCLPETMPRPSFFGNKFWNSSLDPLCDRYRFCPCCDVDNTSRCPFLKRKTLFVACLVVRILCPVVSPMPRGTYSPDQITTSHGHTALFAQGSLRFRSTAGRRLPRPNCQGAKTNLKIDTATTCNLVGRSRVSIWCDSQ